MKKSLFFASVLVSLALTACDGGGSPNPTTNYYTLTGNYAGPIQNNLGETGNIGLVINTDSTGKIASGQLAIRFSQETQDSFIDFSTASVSGNNFSLTGKLSETDNAAVQCSLTLTGTIVGPNEIKGSYAAGDSQPDCANMPPMNVTFDITRQAFVGVKSQFKSIH